jgi:hypothetical protein
MLTGRNGIQHVSIAAATHAAGQHASAIPLFHHHVFLVSEPAF